jgi:hypothetical protein
MVSGIALDQILRFLLGGMDPVALESDGRDDLFLDRSPDTAGFRVPGHMIFDFELLLHCRTNSMAQSEADILHRVPSRYGRDASDWHPVSGGAC